MAIIEVNSLSGYEIIIDNLLEEYKKKGLQRVETKGNKLITYWEKVGNYSIDNNLFYSLYQCHNIILYKRTELLL